MKLFIRFVICLVVGLYSSVSFSVGNEFYETVSPLSGLLPQERINLQDGGKVGHQQEIISLNGNGLPIALSHKFSAYDTWDYNISKVYFDIPQIRFSHHKGNGGNYTNGVYTTSFSCDAPPNDDFFVRLSISGQDINFFPRYSEFLPSRFPSSAKYISPSNWYIECVNSDKLEGQNAFNVVSPSGIEYLLDVYQESRTFVPYYGNGDPYWKDEKDKDIALFVSQISDQHGNKVNYSYDYVDTMRPLVTSYDKPLSLSYKKARLLSISSVNDNRRIDLSYPDNEFISIKVNSDTSDTFSYKSEDSGRTLKVFRKDGKYWEYNFGSEGIKANLSKFKMPNGLTVEYSYSVTGRHRNDYRDLWFLTVPRKVLVKRTVGGSSLDTLVEDYSYSDSSPYTTVFVKSPHRSISYKYEFLKYLENPSTRRIHLGQLLNVSIYPKGTTLTTRNQVGKIKETLYTYTKVADVLDLNSFQSYAYQHRYTSNFKPISRYYSNKSALSKTEIKQDGHSFVTEFKNYDVWGNPSKIEESNSLGESRITNKTYHYDTNNWIIGKLEETSIEGESAKSSFTYNTKGQLTSQTINGIYAEYTYHDDGNLHEIKMYKDGSLRNVMTYADYYRGIARDVTDGEGNTKRVEVYDSGQIKSETDFNGNAATVYTYDSIQRLESITPPVHAATNISWPTELQKVTTRGNYKEMVDYNALMQPVLVTQEDAERDEDEKIYVKTTYDSAGRVDISSAPSFSNNDSLGNKFTYDALGRILTTKHTADITAASFCYGVICDEGVKHGFKLTDARGYKTIKNFRAYGNPDDKNLMLIKQEKSRELNVVSYPGTGLNDSLAITPVYISTTIQRGKHGQITNINQGGKDRSFTYKAGTLLLDTKEEPEVGVTNYLSYDERGMLLRRKVGNSGITTYSYNNNNQIDYIDYPGSTNDVDYEYYYTNLETITTGNNETTLEYLYNELNNIEYETLSIDDANFVTTYYYDTLGNIDQIRMPSFDNQSSARVVDHTVDALGRTREITGFVTDVNYHANGVLASMTYGNDQVFTGTLDEKRLPERIFSEKGTIKPVDLTYSYDINNNVESIIDAAQTGNNRTMAYDGLGRMTTANGSWGTGSIEYTDNHDIDTFTKGGSLLSYGYDDKGRLSHTTGYANKNFSYDDYGNVTSNGTDSFVYDDANQMLSVSNKNIQHTYDGNKKRVKVVTPEKTVYYYYNLAGELLYRYDKTNKKDVEYINLNGKLIAKLEETAPPSAPTLISPSGSVTEVNPTFTWNAVSGASEYLFNIRLDTTNVENRYISAEVLGCAEGTGLCSYEIQSNIYDNTYNWRVKTVNVTGNSEWSTIKTFTIQKLATPITISPRGDITENNPNFKWNAVNGATQYVLRIYNSDGSNRLYRGISPADLNCSNGSGECSYYSTTLPYGNYTWEVKASYGANASEYSILNSFVIVQQVPSIPNLVSPSNNITDSTPTFTWNAVSGAISYDLYTTTTGGAFSRPVTAFAAGCANGEVTCSYNPFVKDNISSQNVGGTYAWKVRSTNSAGDSPWSASRSYTVTSTVVEPSAPTLISPTSDTLDSTPTLTWNAVPSAVTYTIRLYDSSGASLLYYGATASGVNCASGTGTCSYNYTSELEAGSYTWKVGVSNNYSPLVTFTIGEIDTDQDGLSDADEITWGTDPNNPDSDNDGISDGDEVAQGTDPKLNLAVLTVIINYQLLH